MSLQDLPNLSKVNRVGGHDGIPGRHQENNFNLLKWLDEKDKSYSRPIFLSRLPWSMELVLSVPGNCFGVPFHSTVVIPNITVFFFSRNETNSWLWKLLVFSASLVSLLVSWGVLSGVKIANKFSYNPKFGVITPLIGLTLLSLADNEFGMENYQSAKRLGYFQITCWCLATTPIIILKIICTRKRPIVNLSRKHKGSILDPDGSDGFQNPAKHFYVLLSLFLRDPNGSFPSGDASGAMALMYPLLLYGTKENRALATTMIAMSCIGRIYWMAHHISDVFVGVLISFITCRSFEKILGSSPQLEVQASYKVLPHDCNCYSFWWHPIAVNLFLICFVQSTIKFKKRNYAFVKNAETKEKIEGD